MKNKKENNWFPHDCLDEKDPGIIALCSTYKMEGYGRWWKLLEFLRLKEEYKYSLKSPCTYKILASTLMLTEAKARKFIDELINIYQLLQTDGEYIWANMLNEKMAFMEKRKTIFSESGKKGADKTNAKRWATPTKNDNEADEKPAEKSAHNNTIHNNTEQNKTMIMTEQEPQTPEGTSVNTGIRTYPGNENIVAPIAGGGGITNNWEEQKTSALATEAFVYHYISSGQVTQVQLGKWLTAFNRTLEIRGEQPKTPQDYRKHFISWFKFQDNSAEDPDTISPVPAAVRKHAPPAVANAMGYCKTPEQAQADLDRHREERRKKAQQNQKRA